MSGIRRGILVSWAFALSLGAAAASAETVSLAPVRDNTLYEDATGSLSSGVGPALFVGRNNLGANFRRRGLMSFDVASLLPGDAVIESASLSLSVTRAGSVPQSVEVSLHRALMNWGEGASNAGTSGGSGAPAESGDATWLHASFDDVLWNTPGGDFVTESSAGITLVDIDRYTISSTDALVADIQFWLENSAANFGWLLKTPEEVPGTAKAVASRENANSALWPELTITYSVPAADTPGDTDGDGDVDLEDLNNVRNHFGQAGEPVLGDTSPFDGLVDLTDLNNVRNHFGATATPVPEPFSGLLASIGLAAGWLAHRRQAQRGA